PRRFRCARPGGEGTVIHPGTICALMVLLAMAGAASGQEPSTAEAPAALAAAEQPLCGAYCLYAALLALDVDVESLDIVEQRMGPPPASGYSLGQLAQAAASFGVESLGVETTYDRLLARAGRFTCIAH